LNAGIEKGKVEEVVFLPRGEHFLAFISFARAFIILPPTEGKRRRPSDWGRGQPINST